MNVSPVRSLLARSICSCNPSLHRNLLVRQSRQCIRNFSNSSKSARETPVGSSELLQRRYQPLPESVRVKVAEREKAVRRMKLSFVGIILCSACLFGIIQSGRIPPPPTKKQKTQSEESSLLASAPPHPPSPSNTIKFDAPAIVTDVSFDAIHKEHTEQVPTGTSTIPTFPKFIRLSSTDPSPSPGNDTSIGAALPVPPDLPTEYQLLGLGIRTVSFLGIQVYVVGLYVAVPDIATLQERLIRVLDPVATTLVPGERAELKRILLDPERSEEVWNTILKDGGIRSALRIIPTRNTDFMHLRDGWVRGITSRTQRLAARSASSFDDESFGTAVNDFKAIWGGGARKNVPKGETLLMARDADGALTAWYEDQKGFSLQLGKVDDERIARLIWLGYLGGKTVSSEGARASIVDGCIEMVGRPVGTVEEMVL